VNLSTSVLESAIDWLSLSVAPDADGDRVEAHMASLLQREQRAGAQLRPWILAGAVGFAAGRVRYGRAKRGLILQLSGQLADDHADHLIPLAATLTRLDVAVTVKTQEPDPAHGRRQYAAAIDNYHEHPHSARPWQVSDGDGGHTVYLGTRNSDRLLRIYDKCAEAASRNDKEQVAKYQNCWRYELELHDAYANPTALFLAGATNRSALIEDELRRYLWSHSLHVPWDGTPNPTHPGGFRRRSDLDSRLEWIGRTVAPTIRELVTLIGRDAVMDALGLSTSIDGGPAIDEPAE